MSIDQDMERRLSSFTRWWKLTRYRIGTALQDAGAELKTAPASRPYTTARNRKAFDEADIIRADVESPDYEGVSAEALWKAWASGEKNCLLYTSDAADE